MEAVRGLDRESYGRGQEDAFELCLYELNRSKSLDEARRRIEEILGLVKEDKIERLRQMLWMIGR